MALCWSLDKLGPMARSARDAETILRAIAGSDVADPTAVDRPFVGSRRRLRIGVLAKGTRKTMPAVKANFERSLEVLAEFCEIVPDVALPYFPYEAAVETIVRAEAAAAFRDLIESGRSRELAATVDRTGGYVSYATLMVVYIDRESIGILAGATKIRARHACGLFAVARRAREFGDLAANETLPKHRYGTVGTIVYANGVVPMLRDLCRAAARAK